MGCEFVAGRIELAPQIVQEVEDDVDHANGDVVNSGEDVEDFEINREADTEDTAGAIDRVASSASRFMTASVSEQSATRQAHCVYHHGVQFIA